MILVLTIVAFSDSLGQISSANKPGLNTIPGGFFGAFNYVYMACLGDLN
jgi:hypothetical protein